MMRLSAWCGVAALVMITGAAWPQIFVQLDCQIVLKRDEDRVSVYGVMRSTQPASADYTLEVLKIDASGSGASEQGGKAELTPGDLIRTGLSSFNLSKDGWIEFKLTVTERLTGQTCQAQNAVLPL